MTLQQKWNIHEAEHKNLELQLSTKSLIRVLTKTCYKLDEELGVALLRGSVRAFHPTNPGSNLFFKIKILSIVFQECCLDRKWHSTPPPPQKKELEQTLLLTAIRGPTPYIYYYFQAMDHPGYS